MDYLKYMDELSRGWREPYFQDMGRFRPHSNAWESTYHAQEDYEMEAQLELLTIRIEELDCSNLMVAKAMHEAKWQPTHCSKLFMFPSY